jgi:hypothetical protein
MQNDLLTVYATFSIPPPRSTSSKPRPQPKRLRGAEAALYAAFFARADGTVWRGSEWSVTTEGGVDVRRWVTGMNAGFRDGGGRVGGGAI